MSAKHTPGPWIAVGAWVEVPNDKVPDICTCDPAAIGQEKLPRTHAQQCANARLIAAAPDLLELLTLAMPYVEEGEEFNAAHKRDLSLSIRAAIVRATVRVSARKA